MAPPLVCGAWPATSPAPDSPSSRPGKKKLAMGDSAALVRTRMPRTTSTGSTPPKREMIVYIVCQTARLAHSVPSTPQRTAPDQRATPGWRASTG